jgi:hypothetical protein
LLESDLSFGHDAGLKLDARVAREVRRTGLVIFADVGTHCVG